MVTRLRHLHIECLDNTSPTLREVARRTDTESEFEKEMEEEGDLAEITTGDGPSDSTSRLKVYSQANHFTNIRSLD